MDEYSVVEKKILDSGHIALYGAGVTAYNIAAALKELYHIKIEKFYVTSVTRAGGFFGGLIPVEFSGQETYAGELILVATPNEYHAEIEEKLIASGIPDYILVNQDLEYSIMSRYFRRTLGLKMIEDLHATKEEQEAEYRTYKTEIYMAKSVKDKKLKNVYELPEWIIPVQAGGALTERRILSVTDNDGISISGKNRDYSELTVTYWAWKNKDADYMGICHYRRMLLLTQRDIKNVIQNKIDAVLPLPFVCSPDASEQFYRYVTQEDFHVFMKIIEEVMPYNLEAIRKILTGKIIYNYNMLLAKKYVFNDYCEFVFSILEKMEEYYISRGIERNDRYLGYFGELLTSTYFIMNSDKLKIVHAGRLWMV